MQYNRFSVAMILDTANGNLSISISYTYNS